MTRETLDDPSIFMVTARLQTRPEATEVHKGSDAQGTTGQRAHGEGHTPARRTESPGAPRGRQDFCQPPPARAVGGYRLSPSYRYQDFGVQQVPILSFLRSHPTTTVKFPAIGPDLLVYRRRG